MRRKRKEKNKMTFPLPLSLTDSIFERVDYHEKDVVSASTEDNDTLNFMETFTFPGLAEIESDLEASGEYTGKQIKRLISGLKTMPEYNVL
jgi:hypothetical protein